MIDYAPKVRKQSELIALHVGTNEIVMKISASNIASVSGN